MPGPIATLAVRISAQIAEFQQSFNDASKSVEGFKSSFEKAAAGIQGTLDGISKTFSQFGSVVGTIGVAVAGVTVAAAAVAVAFKGVSAAVSTAFETVSNAVSHTAELGDQLFGLSQKTDLTVESLSAFKFVAAQTNTSLESITGAVFKMQTNLGKGSKETKAALDGIGLSLKDLRAQDPSEAFASIISKLGELPNASARAAAGVAIFGKSFKDIAQLSKEDLPALIAQAKELGVVMSQETAVASDRLKDGLGAIHAATEGLTQQLGAKLIPAAVAFVEVFGGIFIDAIKQVTRSTKGLGEGFDSFVVFVGEAAARFIEVLARMVSATAQWAADISKRIAEETKDFLDLAPSIITVGRALDLALGGGTHQSAFDALSKNLEALRKPLDTVAAGAVAAGNTIRDFATGIAEAARGAGANFGATFTKIQTEIAASADAMRKSLKAVGSGGLEGAKEAGDAFSSLEKQLKSLTAQIDRAKGTGTPLAEIVKLFGEEAAKATPKAHAFGITVSASVEEVAQAFDRADLAKEMQFVSRAVLKLNDDLNAFSTKEMQKEMTDLAKVAKTAIDEVEAQLNRIFEKQQKQDIELNVLNTPLNVAGFGFGLGALGFTSGQIASFGLFGQKAAQATTAPFRDAFRKLGDELPQIILGALQGGGSVLASVAQGIATVLGNSFKQAFEKALADVGGDLSKLSAKTKALAVAGVGLQAFTSGFAIGDAAGSKGKGALGGAGAGAVAGLPLAAATGGLSVAIGAGIGAIGGFFGGRAAEREAKAALEQSKIALAAQFGGLEKLRTLAEKLGVNIQQAFDAKKPEQFQAAVDKLNAAIDGQNKRIEGLNRALAAVNDRAGTFAKQFDGLDKTAIAELAQRAQPEFERLGLAIRDTFAGLIKENGDAFAAIESLGPAFETLKKGVSDFGLTGNAVIDGLLADFDLVNSEITGPFLKNVQESGAILKGLFDAKALSPEGFQALAADIGQSLQEVANRGGDMAKAFALSQPVLQSLWEAQKTFGAVTDQTTQSILDQAVQQGIVGAQFQSIQDKQLQVLLAIAHVFHADIPDGIEATASAAQAAGKTITDTFGDAADTSAHNIEFKIGRSLAGLPGKAGTAADGIERALSGIDVPPIPISLDLDASALDRIPDDIRIRTTIEGPDVPAFGTGGIVHKRTLAIIGEAGPEAVVPLNRMGEFRSPAGPVAAEPSTVVFEEGAVVIHGPVDSTARAEQVVRDFARAVRNGGATRTVALRSLGLEKV